MAKYSFTTNDDKEAFRWLKSEELALAVWKFLTFRPQSEDTEELLALSKEQLTVFLDSYGINMEELI